MVCTRIWQLTAPVERNRGVGVIWLSGQVSNIGTKGVATEWQRIRCALKSVELRMVA